MITLVGTPDPEPRPSLIWLRPVTDAVPWLRETRDDTVSLGTSVDSGWTNLNFPINPKGSPA